MSEFDKISKYLAEAEKLWATNQELVQSRQFYCLWEESCQPLPFAVPLAGLRLGRRQVLPAAGADVVRVAYFAWHDDEHCAALMVETTEATQAICLRLVDGAVQLDPQKPESFREDGGSYGERVEIMAGVVADIRDHYPGVDLKHVQNAMILEALQHLRGRFPAELLRGLEKSTARARLALVEKVLADMATDELSLQLTLNYGLVAPASDMLAEAGTAAIPSAEVLPSTAWAVKRRLALLVEAARKVLAAEEHFVLSFQGAESLSPANGAGVGVVKLPLRGDGSMPLREGSRLVVFPYGQPQTPLAEFVVDILDSDELVGTLSWSDPALVRPCNELLCAGLRKTPQAFITRSLQELQRLLAADEIPAAAVLRGVLGLTPVPYLFRPGPPVGCLDSWQSRAVAACLDSRHSVVLIQGPPGTGKTCVIEKMLRELCRQPMRIVLTAPSNAAVDNLCRRLLDLPLLRHGSSREAAQEDVASACWYGDDAVQAAFSRKREAWGCELHAGTPIGLLRSPALAADVDARGLFDVIVFDEAGMGGAAETLLCLCLARRAFFFGDPQQLPPFPLPPEIWSELEEGGQVLTREERAFIGGSFLGWLQEFRHFPCLLLRNSYRCQNPRLMRFASHLFYNAQVQASPTAEYYQLSYKERQQRYPAATLRFVSTSRLPLGRRQEQVVTAAQPGIENQLEAEICGALVRSLCGRYPLAEITVITPYRRQLRLIRKRLAEAPPGVSADAWSLFLQQRVSTVDSFQGGESDVVVISYVRSGGKGVGFVDDPNRVNVTHTRSRREMIVVGDADFLQKRARNRIFTRMLRAMARDGVVEELDEAGLAGLLGVPAKATAPAAVSPSGGRQLTFGF